MTRSARICAVLMTAALSLWSTQTLAQSLPNGWATADIGSVGAAGSASGSAGSFTVTAAGADIWGTADALRYVYLPLTGDGAIVSQVNSIQPVANWTKAGVMMREALSASSAQAMMIVSANKGLAFQRRVVAGGVSTSTGGGDRHCAVFREADTHRQHLHRRCIARRRGMDDHRVGHDRDGVDHLRRPRRQQPCHGGRWRPRRSVRPR